MKITLKDITPCPWNTRGEISAESVAELAKSIDETGLLSPIVIWKRTDAAGWYCIAGCRRLAAMKSIDGYDFDESDYAEFDGDEQGAKRVTIIENLQRESIDPIAEAQLVGELLDGGMAAHDIAAKLGKGDAWVSRRAKLTKLDAKLGDLVRQSPSRFSFAGLEMIAELPDHIQTAVVERVVHEMEWRDTLRREDVMGMIGGLSQTLDGAPFTKDADALAKCEACMNRTGCQGDLFGVRDGDLGRCLDKKCFSKCEKDYETAAIAKAVGDAETVRMKYAWEAPSEANGKKRDKMHPCAYVHVYNGEVSVKWGPSKKAADAAKKKAEDEKRERFAESEAVRKRVEGIVKKLSDVFDFEEGKETSDALDGAIRRLVVPNLPETDMAARCIRDFICQYHEPDEWAEIVTTFKFVATIATLTEADVEFLAKNANA